MKKTLLVTLAVALFLTVASAAAAQPMIVEMDPKAYDRMGSVTEADAGIDAAVCDLYHEIYPDFCAMWHVIAVIEIRFEGMEPAQGLRLENARGEAQDYRIDRTTPHYHLDTGAIFEPNGDWNARNAAGEQWTQIRPMQEQARTVAHWQDGNRDGLVNAGDTVVFADGSSHKLIDVRIGMHLSPIDR